MNVDRPVRMSRWERSPDESVHGQGGANVNSTRISIADRTIAIIAIVVAAAAIGAVWMQSNKDPQILDAKLRASAAEVRADVQQQIADARAVAQAGKEHARIALDEVQRSNAQLEAKGLIRRPASH